MKYKTSIKNSEIITKFLKFYLLTDVITLTGLILCGTSDSFDRLQNKFATAVILAPIIETFVVHLPCIVLLKKLKFGPKTVIFTTAFIFASLHIIKGPLSPLMIFYPGLMMTWCFYFYYTRCNLVLALLFTIILHSVYNFTSLIL